MKPTDQTPKIALLNVSPEMASDEFLAFVDILHRTGHELVSSSNYIIDLISRKKALLVTPRCQVNIARITLFVLDRNAENLNYQLPCGSQANDSATSIVKGLCEKNTTALVVVDSADYDWLIRKKSNVQGIRGKDRDWLMMKAAVVFDLKPSTVLRLADKVRPRLPSLTTVPM